MSVTINVQENSNFRLDESDHRDLDSFITNLTTKKTAKKRKQPEKSPGGSTSSTATVTQGDNAVLSDGRVRILVEPQENLTDFRRSKRARPVIIGNIE